MQRPLSLTPFDSSPFRGAMELYEFKDTYNPEFVYLHLIKASESHSVRQLPFQGRYRILRNLNYATQNNSTNPNLSGRLKKTNVGSIHESTVKTELFRY